jgi:7-cyano-7-deazaguanine reductase
MNNTIEHLKAKSQLGKKTSYSSNYDPSLLFAIARKEKREEIGVGIALPFVGIDIWNAYEVSWLNKKGKPVVAIAIIKVDAKSPFLFESKSLKLYLNSFNSSHFESFKTVQETIACDLSTCAQSIVSVTLHTLEQSPLNKICKLQGQNIDGLDITTDCYDYNPEFLTVVLEKVSEQLTSHLLKSNCLITNQPDWGSLYISYSGNKISHEGLLKYIISLRCHNEFHEQCVERIFVDIMRYCKPLELTVCARYTRRGGIDINPMRTNAKSALLDNLRLIRQ